MIKLSFHTVCIFFIWKTFIFIFAKIYWFIAFNTYHHPIIISDYLHEIRRQLIPHTSISVMFLCNNFSYCFCVIHFFNCFWCMIISIKFCTTMYESKVYSDTFIFLVSISKKVRRCVYVALHRHRFFPWVVKKQRKRKVFCEIFL